VIKNVHLIVNPASGKDYPILSVANSVLKEMNIDWEINVTKKDQDAENFARVARLQKVDAVVVHGGDGTIMEVARALAGSSIPLLILPGGTLNVLSKELLIPQNPKEALSLLNDSLHTIKVIDTFTCNERPFVLRLNAGLFADAVKNTKREDKNILGSIAYTVTALTKVSPQIANYDLIVDGDKYTLEGVSLTINNIGNVGLTGISYRSNIEPDDGFLDILLMKNADLLSITELAAQAVIPDKVLNLENIRGKDITLKINPPQTIVCDDEIIEADQIEVKIVPKSLSLIVQKL
jgi:diacylglycerol kinase family enzyme